MKIKDNYTQFKDITPNFVQVYNVRICIILLMVNRHRYIPEFPLFNYQYLRMNNEGKY